MNVLFTTAVIILTELLIGVIGAVLFEIASRKDKGEEDDTT
jgi:hypothetical protein